MSMELAKHLARDAGERGRTYRHAWTNKMSKTPRHLRFGDGGELSYMRDGVLTTTNGFAGSYTRLVEFAGDSRDQHEVEIKIPCDVFNGDVKLEPNDALDQSAAPIDVAFKTDAEGRSIASKCRSPG